MCIKSPFAPPNPILSPLNEASPRPRLCSHPALRTVSNTSTVSSPEKTSRPSTTSTISFKRPYTSRLDKAMRVYISHFSEKAMKRALKDATSQEETPPSSSSIQALKSSGGLTVSLVTEMQKLRLEYKPSHLEVTASIHSELGNSIHNSSSVARRSVDLYGLRVFKACTVVHELLKSAERNVEGSVDEGVREEVVWWFEVLGHDLGVGGEGGVGERGYATLLRFYITYLKALLGWLVARSSGTKSTSMTSNLLSAHQTQSLSNHVFREALLRSITDSPVSAAGAKIAALRLVVRDALEFAGVHEMLLQGMRREMVCESVVLERECVFEGRREEVVGFVRRCREVEVELNMNLDLDLGGGDGNGENRDLGVEGLGKAIAELRV